MSSARYDRPDGLQITVTRAEIHNGKQTFAYRAFTRRNRVIIGKIYADAEYQAILRVEEVIDMQEAGMIPTVNYEVGKE